MPGNRRSLYLLPGGGGASILLFEKKRSLKRRLWGARYTEYRVGGLGKGSVGSKLIDVAPFSFG